MNHQKMAEVMDYFEDIPEFYLLPKHYRYRVIDFFMEDRHSFVDRSDTGCFIRRGTKFTVFTSQDKLIASLKENPLPEIGILWYKKHFKSEKDAMKWINNIGTLEDHIDPETKASLTVMTHIFGCTEDDPEEWYILSKPKPTQQLIDEQLVHIDWGRLCD